MNLKHQNIIRVYDIFKDNKMIFALTELAENGNLY
jgi:hypothetical protein